MNCGLVVPNISHHSTYSPSSSSASCNNVFALPSHPVSPNVMVRFQPMEGLVSGSNHHQELPLLKRKRPMKITVPIAKLSNLLSVSNTPRDHLETLEEVEVEGDGYGVYCKRGRSRARMEDRYSVIVHNIHGNSKQAFFGVFDGHGGAKAAEFVAARLGQNILDNVGKETGNKCDKDIEENIKEGYLATDAEFLVGNASGGSCCITALIRQGKVMVSNVGDCRAVISRGGVAEALTTDHAPSRADEKMRIEAKGGYVDNCNGVWRIQGSLAVSRAIGDRHLKEWVTAEPDTTIVNIQPECEFLILASDGLWGKVTNQEAVDIVLPFCTGETNKWELAKACKKLAELSISNGSNDDISLMVIQLGRFD